MVVSNISRWNCTADRNESAATAESMPQTESQRQHHKDKEATTPAPSVKGRASLTSDPLNTQVMGFRSSCRGDAHLVPSSDRTNHLPPGKARPGSDTLTRGAPWTVSHHPCQCTLTVSLGAIYAERTKESGNRDTQMQGQQKSKKGHQYHFTFQKGTFEYPI